MNLFVGVGTIRDVYENGRVLKFTLSIQQKKTCNIPCLIFDPSDEVKKLVEQLQNKKKDLADAILQADNNLIKSLTIDDLKLLLS